ncbi:TatD family hydrolase [Parafilimonas sp.]|uniref:TatD family hydrolase n=1 Tax=Parafilimonas sp. TaxID=1969739 RepID=UPI0039E719DF
MQLIDTHCHLYLPEFKEDLANVLLRAESENVNRFYLPCVDSSVINDMLTLEQASPGKCFAMAGLHPCSVNQNFLQELSQIKDFSNKISFPAVGEIGLDFHWSTAFMHEQYQAFEMQMQWALEEKLPIVIHTRNAMEETIRFVKPYADKGLKGIFHCFGGSYEEAAQIIEMGFLLGIGGVLTYKKSGLEQTLANIDLIHIVLETDAPYLTPAPYRGRRNESSYIKIIAQKLAEVKNTSLEEVAAVTTANAEKIFGK